jgi:IS30 family transposase
LRRAERVEIAYLKRKKYSVRAISRALDRSVSTISDELQRNKVRGRYDPRKAHHKAYVRRKYAKYQGKKIVESLPLREFVEERLYDDQSPRAIAGRLKKREKKLPSVSKNSIYRYIESPYGRRLEYHRSKRKRRRRKGGRTKIFWKNRRNISQRPKAAEARERVGDAEGDFIVSGKSGHGILFVVVDRKLRISFVEQILKPTAKAVTRAAKRIKKRYPEWRTMTTDNDVLLQHHAALEQKLGIKIYFCNPFHSWEKGTVENTNGQIRRTIPKGSDISKYSTYVIRKVEEKLNRRFMECLKFLTPAEAVQQHRRRKKRRRGATR